jgi:hypothetical protein
MLLDMAAQAVNLLCILGILAACQPGQSPSPGLTGTPAPINSCNHNCSITGPATTGRRRGSATTE